MTQRGPYMRFEGWPLPYKTTLGDSLKPAEGSSHLGLSANLYSLSCTRLIWKLISASVPSAIAKRMV
jgi:hypothetical protein